MLSKAIATGFNAPFVSIPGSGFAQTFIGMDAVTVRWLAWKAKRLARKWGGQCIVFIDEIDAVGMRRQSLGQPGGGTGMGVARFEELAFHGPWGALNPSGDLVLETRAWRDRLFAERYGAPAFVAPAFLQRIGGIVNQAMPGMFGGGGGLALNQLLVVMDGIGSPRWSRKFPVKLVNTLLDAVYIVPDADQGRPAADEARAAGVGADLLHRRVQRADRDARPRADARGPDGPPRLVPDADEAGPARRLRPLPREGRARGRAQ